MNQTQTEKFDDPTLRAVYAKLLEAKGALVPSRALKDAAGARWRDAINTLRGIYGARIEVTLGGSGNQSFRLTESHDIAVEVAPPPSLAPPSLAPPRVVNVDGRDVATQMHPSLDPLVRGPQLLTEPAPHPIPNPAPLIINPIIHPAVTTVVGAMLPDMATAWHKLHGSYPSGVVLPFALKTSLREFAVDIRRLGLRVFFGEVTELTFVLEGTALLTEDARAQRPHPDALY